MNRTDTEDSEPPKPVADIEPSAVTTDRLSLRWPAPLMTSA